MPEGDARMRRYVRDNVIVLLGQIANILQALVLIPLLIKTKDAATYGTWAVLSSVLNVVLGVSPLGVGYLNSRFLPTTSDRAGRRALFYPQALFQAASLATMIVVGGMVVHWLPGAMTHSFSPGLAATFLIAAAAYNQTNLFLRYTNRIAACTAQSTLLVYGQIIAAAGFAAAGALSINALLASQVVMLVLVTLPGVVVISRDLGGPLVWPRVAGVLADIKLGLPLIAGYVLDMILAVGDRSLLLMFLSSADVGAYAAAYTVGTLPVLLPRAVGMVIPQMMSAAVDSGQPDRARGVVSLTMSLFAAIAIPFCAGSVLLSGQVLTAIADADVAARARGIVPVIAVASVFYGTCLLLLQLLFVHAKTRMMLGASAIAAAVNIGANILLLSIYPSIVVPAVVTLLSYGVMLVVMLRHLQPNWRAGPSRAVILRAVIASAVMMAVVALIGRAGFPSGVAALAVGVTAGITVYVATMVVLGVARLPEWRELRLDVS